MFPYKYIPSTIPAAASAACACLACKQVFAYMNKSLAK